MRVGDVVIKIHGDQLHCGSGWYTHAICVSVDPFVLVSEEGDMLWRKLDAGQCRALCQAHPDIVAVAMKRFNSGY